MDKKKEEMKMTKMVLKLKRPHPANHMQMGKHIITHVAQEFMLCAKDMEELESVGGKHWFMEAEMTKTKAKKSLKEKAKKLLD